MTHLTLVQPVDSCGTCWPRACDGRRSMCKRRIQDVAAIVACEIVTSSLARMMAAGIGAEGQETPMWESLAPTLEEALRICLATKGTYPRELREQVATGLVTGGWTAYSIHRHLEVTWVEQIL